MSALDAVQASDADVAKRMTAADQMATADLEDFVQRLEAYARGKGAAAEDDAEQELGVGGAE